MIVIRKADIDTVLTAIILNIENFPIKVIDSVATDKEIFDKSIYCIECGGSGLIEYNNFDHHDPKKNLPCACEQASNLMKIDDNYLKKLVKYVSILDLTPYKLPEIKGIHLSYIFSGMLMYYSNSVKVQFLEGVKILKYFIKKQLNPFMPVTPQKEWLKYIEKKIENYNKLQEALKNCKYGYTKNNKKYAIFVFNGIGGSSYFYKQKQCDIVVLHNPDTKKTCVMSQNTSLKKLLEIINKFEPDWGGRDTIICSSEKNSNFHLKNLEKIIKIIF